jgi:nicotinamide-nucleotide amidase
VFIAISHESETEAVERRFPGDRDRIRLWASFTAMDLLRRKLM